MKTFRYLIYSTFILLAAGMASCTQEEFKPGEPDLENCYGVYFDDAQQNTGSLMLDPSDPRSLTFSVSRLKEDGEIEVPVVVEGSEEGIFEAEPLIFEDGQRTAVLTVNFDKAESSKNYSCRLSLEDPQYALVYGQNSLSVDFSLVIIEWELVTGTGGEQTGMWRDDIISSYFIPAAYNEQYAEHEVTVYKRKDIEGYYRVDNAYTQEYVESMLNVALIGATPSCSNPSLVINATDPEKVWIDLQSIGVDLGGSYSGVLSICSNVEEVISNADNLYGTLENGVIEFPANGILFEKGGSLYLANTAAKTRLILPGYEAPDYSLSLQAGACTDGSLPVTFVKGTDVASVKYAVYTGRLDDGQVFTYADNIIRGEEPNVKTLGAGESSVTVSGMETGFYTLVAVAYDAEGNDCGYTSVSFGYVAQGDDMSVQIDAGMIVSDKYAPQGFTSENSIEYYIYGEDIENAYLAFYETSSLSGASDMDLVSDILSKAENTMLGSAEISQINNEGYVDILTGLDPATSYTMVVYADNGYESTLVKEEATTLGAPLNPLEKIYTDSDIYMVDKSDLISTWDYYAVPLGADARAKIGQVTISESPEEDGPEDDWMTVEGLLGPAAEEMGVNDSFTFSYYGGVLYTMTDVQNIDGYYGQLLYLGVNAQGTAPYSGDYLMMLGATGTEGYLAFPRSTVQGIQFVGIYYGIYADTEGQMPTGDYVAYTDMMLVDPSANADAGTAALSGMSAIDKISLEWSKGPANYVETPDGRMKSLIDRYTGGFRPVPASLAGIGAKVDSRSVAFDASPAAPEQNVSGSFLNKKEFRAR